MICLANPGSALAADTFDGVYTGTRVLTKGSDQTCPAREAVSTSIHGEMLTFTDGSLRNFALSFDPRPDGTFGQISVGVEGSAVLIRGRITGDIIDADVTSGSCDHWHLAKEPRTQ
jgi:hypothetical protein